MPQLPTFQTERLILTELQLSDAPTYTKHFINYEVIRHLSATVPWPYPEDGVLNYMTHDILPYQGIDKWVWKIALRDDPDELIGAIELVRKASPANRGFWLGQPYWGKGYMTEAVKPVTDYAFESLGFEKLVFSNAVDNRRSSRIKEKSGARFIRYEPAQYVDPAHTERALYELTKDMWLAQS